MKPTSLAVIWLTLAFATPASAQQLIWGLQFGGHPRAQRIHALAQDGEGGVFATGRPGLPYPVAPLYRFDAAADMTLETYYDCSEGCGCGCFYRALYPDGEGGLYIGGSSGGPFGTSSVGEILRADADGSVVWKRTIRESVTQVTPDRSGGVYAAGMADQPGSTRRDAFVARYSADGVLIWVEEFRTELDDAFLGIAPDGAQGMFAGGFSGEEAVIARYDAAGALIDIVKFDAGGSARIEGLAADGNGGVLACGALGNLPRDAFVARFDATLDLVWMQVVGSTGDDGFNALLPDGRGGVLVAGYTSGDLAAPNAGGIDCVLARVNAQRATWIEQFGSTGDDIAYALATDDTGGVYVGGSAGGELFGPFVGGGVTDSFLALYEAQRCPDVDGDDIVGVLDLLAVLAAWGRSDGAEDVNDDGVVDIIDLLAVLAAWGPCR
jgi:hypothetical protein